jgi:catechol 2,3-dioxygenase-like lactoylglutathione lyase family enzyme
MPIVSSKPSSPTTASAAHSTHLLDDIPSRRVAARDREHGLSDARLGENAEMTVMNAEPSRDFDERRHQLATTYLRSVTARPESSARGLHHTALVSGDVERTIQFYQELLEFPLTELIENRDYRGSTHFFFDIGNSNLLAFFDFPGLDLEPYKEVYGGLHHLAISVEPQRWQHLKDKLATAGVEVSEHSQVSLYFRDPDGARIELIADPLGEMYGTKVL